MKRSLCLDLCSRKETNEEIEEINPNRSKKKTNEKLKYRVLFPLAHFRQVTDEQSFDVFAYPLMDGDLMDYIEKNKPTGEKMRNIFIQSAERNVFFVFQNINLLGTFNKIIPIEISNL